jgi:hypothetical protein
MDPVDDSHTDPFLNLRRVHWFIFFLLNYSNNVEDSVSQIFVILSMRKFRVFLLKIFPDPPLKQNSHTLHSSSASRTAVKKLDL